MNNFLTDLKNLYEKKGKYISNKHSPKCVFKLSTFNNNKESFEYLRDNFKINIVNEKVILEGPNCFDFLTSIYPKYHSILKINKNKIPVCKFTKLDENAECPIKYRASDVGYDITIIKEDKKISTNTIMYGTGISVSPPVGYYTKIVPRSSLVKTGYMLSNSVGIIDCSYRGELKVVLTKIDHTLPDIKLPLTCVQLILEKHIHYNMKKVDCLSDTDRGKGGFGSTNLVVSKKTSNCLQNDKLITDPIEAANIVNNYIQNNENIIIDYDISTFNDKVSATITDTNNIGCETDFNCDGPFKNKKLAKRELNIKIANSILNNEI